MPRAPTAPKTPDVEVAPTGAFALNVAVDASARPYIDEWFVDRARAGEALDRFLLRTLYEAAMQHRAAKLQAKNGGDHSKQERDYQEFTRAEQTRISAAIEGTLP